MRRITNLAALAAFILIGATAARADGLGLFTYTSTISQFVSSNIDGTPVFDWGSSWTTNPIAPITSTVQFAASDLQWSLSGTFGDGNFAVSGAEVAVFGGSPEHNNFNLAITDIIMAGNPYFEVFDSGHWTPSQYLTPGNYQQSDGLSFFSWAFRQFPNRPHTCSC